MFHTRLLCDLTKYDGDDDDFRDAVSSQSLRYSSEEATEGRQQVLTDRHYVYSKQAAS